MRRMAEVHEGALMRRMAEVHEGRKESREKNYFFYHPPHTFSIMESYVAFKLFVSILNLT